MNAIALKNSATLRALRHWYANWRGTVLPHAARPACAPEVAPRVPAASCQLVPVSAKQPQAKRGGLATLQQWYDQQTKPCTIAVYIDSITLQPISFHALSSDAARELIASPAYNAPNAEWEMVNPHCLRRANCELARQLGEQEFSLRQFEDLLAARWAASQDLTKLYDQCLRNWATAYPDQEDAPNITMAQRRQALAQMRTTMLQSGASLKAMVALDESLIAALQMLGVPLPDEGIQQRQAAMPAQALG